MDHEYNINWYIKELYEELLDQFTSYIKDASEELTLPDILELGGELYDKLEKIYNECNNDYNKKFSDIISFSCVMEVNKVFDIKLQIDNDPFLFKIFDLFTNNFKSFIDDNKYKLACLYAVKRLVNLGIDFNVNNEDVCTGYSLQRLCTDNKFDSMLYELLSYNYSNISLLNTFCTSLNNNKSFFDYFDSNIKGELNSFITNDKIDEQKLCKIKNMMMKRIACNIPPTKKKDLSELSELCKRIITMFHIMRLEYKIGIGDIKDILYILFQRNKLVEIFIYKLIVSLGFPSIFNPTLNEREMDILTFISSDDIKIIEVTTGRLSWDYINTKHKTLDDLQKESGKSVKSLIIYDGRKCYCNGLYDNMDLVSMEEIFTNYPYRLLQELYS